MRRSGGGDASFLLGLALGVAIGVAVALILIAEPQQISAPEEETKTRVEGAAEGAAQ